ncbi:MAG: RluA family pseudouridine synthase, partial [Acutalibacter sp.]|nr:RluA family pseudouridine synthase [Acutalibacter sp.]
MPRRTVAIEKNDGGQRLDKFLLKAYPNLPPAVLYKCVRTKDVKLNGKRCQADQRLREGDVLTLYWQEDFFQKAPESHDFLKAPKALSIVYE